MFGGSNNNQPFNNQKNNETNTNTNKNNQQERVIIPRTLKLLEELEAGEKGTAQNSHHCSLGLADNGTRFKLA